jgi:hypothetical protein
VEQLAAYFQEFAVQHVGWGRWFRHAKAPVW